MIIIITNNNNVSLSIIKELKNAYSWQNDKMTMTFFESMNQEDMYHWFATNDKPSNVPVPVNHRKNGSNVRIIICCRRAFAQYRVLPCASDGLSFYWFLWKVTNKSSSAKFLWIFLHLSRKNCIFAAKICFVVWME